jgi:uncharacterized membrane protein
MAATTQQGKSFTLFMVGITATATGIAFISSGTGKVALVIGVLAVAISLFGFLKIKPLEGVTAEGAQPAVMKLAGVGLALLGWLVVLIGLHLTASVSGRMTTTILGLVVSLAGVLFILPTASSKNAIWKA